MIDPVSAFKSYADKLKLTLDQLNDSEVTAFISLLSDARLSGNTVFIIGNGGSAAASSHWATDLGKGLHHRKSAGIKALSLAENMSWVSAMANDSSYELIFSDQLRAHGKTGDLLISISASGNSANIVHAIKYAKGIGLKTLSVVGFDGGEAKRISDYVVHIPTQKNEYGLVEDIQMVLNHFACDYLSGKVQ